MPRQPTSPALTAAAPPPDVRAKVLAEISTTRQLSPLPDAVVRLADRRRSRPLMAALAVAAAVTCFVVGAVVVGGLGRDDGFDDTVAAIMLEPGAQVAQLAGEGTGTIRIAWSGDRAAVIGDDLPDASRGFGLRAVADRRRRSAADAACSTRPTTVAMRRVVPVDGQPAAWGVTIEPESGSTTPTMPILFVAEVADRLTRSVRREGERSPCPGRRAPSVRS